MWASRRGGSKGTPDGAPTEFKTLTHVRILYRSETPRPKGPKVPLQ